MSGTGEDRFVRIVEYDPKNGCVVRNYSHRTGGEFLNFSIDSRDWVRVNEKIADQLSRVRQHPNKKNSPLVFDVKTEVEARVIDNREKEEREAVRKIIEKTVDNAIDLTSVGRGDIGLDEISVSRNEAMKNSISRMQINISPDAKFNTENDTSIDNNSDNAKKTIPVKRRSSKRKISIK